MIQNLMLTRQNYRNLKENIEFFLLKFTLNKAKTKLIELLHEILIS